MCWKVSIARSDCQGVPRTPKLIEGALSSRQQFSEHYISDLIYDTTPPAPISLNQAILQEVDVTPQVQIIQDEKTFTDETHELNEQYMSYLKSLIAETQTPDTDIDYYHTTSKDLFNRGEEILAKIETNYDQVQKEKDALVNAHKEYMADAVPLSQQTYSSVKHFRYSALPYGRKVIDSNIDVQKPGVGDKLEHYANELISNLEQLTGKLIETKKGMQKDILLTQKCQEKSETFIKQERLIMDKTQTLNEQEAKVKGNMQLINGKYKEQIEQKEKQEISDLIQDKILDETVAVNEEYLKIMKRAQDNLGEFTSKFDELQRIKHFEHAAQLRVFCELLEKVFKRGIDLTKEEVQVLDRLKRSLYSGINDLPSAFAQHQKVTAGIKSEKTLQEQFFILKQSLIFDLFVPSNTLSSYLLGITKQFYLSHLIHRFSPDYLSSHAKPATTATAEYMYLEHLENLVAQGRLGEAVREIETRGFMLKDMHRREVEEWAKEVRKREYIGVQVEAMRRQADMAVEMGVQELRRQKIL